MVSPESITGISDLWLFRQPQDLSIRYRLEWIFKAKGEGVVKVSPLWLYLPFMLKRKVRLDLISLSSWRSDLPWARRVIPPLCLTTPDLQSDTNPTGTPCSRIQKDLSTVRNPRVGLY
jgi:hypothetical protein